MVAPVCPGLSRAEGRQGSVATLAATVWVIGRLSLRARPFRRLRVGDSLRYRRDLANPRQYFPNDQAPRADGLLRPMRWGMRGVFEGSGYRRLRRRGADRNRMRQPVGIICNGRASDDGRISVIQTVCFRTVALSIERRANHPDRAPRYRKIGIDKNIRNRSA